MFKNAMAFQFAYELVLKTANSPEVHERKFVPCSPSSAKSVGWTGLRHEGDALQDLIGGRLWMRARIETKRVPADAINREYDKIVKAMEDQEGRKPGRKESRDIKDAIVADLLPHAFPKLTDCLVCFDADRNQLLLSTASQGVADDVVSMLVSSFPSLSISMVNTVRSPQQTMTAWLLDPDTVPDDIEIGRSTTLKSVTEEKSTVKFDRHNLGAEQMRMHIQEGKLPTQLEIECANRISVSLTEGMVLKKIALLDVEPDDDAGADADFYMYGEELFRLVDMLVASMGGQS